MVRGGSGAGPLTGARVVLEGAHAVPVGRERAHTLSCVRQPALDGPVRAARVYMPVHKLRRRDAGTLGPQGAAQSCLSASERKGREGGGARNAPTRGPHCLPNPDPRSRCFLCSMRTLGWQASRLSGRPGFTSCPSLCPWPSHGLYSLAASP